MALVPISTRNRIDPLTVSNLNAYDMLYTYDHGRHHKHRRRRHHHHHHKKHKSHFWNGLIPRVETPSSAVTIHSVELDERRPYYTTEVNERAIVPVNQTERQIVSTTRTRPIVNDDYYVREAWTNNPSRDDEVVCCRAYNGCRCPCWCFIIFIIFIVILIIILIVLLATLL